MSDAALGILKGCLLALVYLFLLRVVLLVASELRGTPGLGRAAAPAGPVAAAGSRRQRAKAGKAAARAAKAAQPRKGGRDAGKGWRLVVAEPSSAHGTAFAVDGEVTIGRGGGCTIALPADTYVSTVHARAYDVDGELWIEDLGSTNGTLVNDHKVEQPARLQRGDRIRVGSTVLEATR